MSQGHMSTCIPNQQLLLNTIINDVNLNYAELYRMMLLIGYGSSELKHFSFGGTLLLLTR